MIRTQIYLTTKQHSLLKERAHKENATLSEALREIIDKDLLKDQGKEKQNAGDWLLEMAQEAEKLEKIGPADLASNVDGYLYGG